MNAKEDIEFISRVACAIAPMMDTALGLAGAIAGRPLSDAERIVCITTVGVDQAMRGTTHIERIGLLQGAAEAFARECLRERARQHAAKSGADMGTAQ